MMHKAMGNGETQWYTGQQIPITDWALYDWDTLQAILQQVDQPKKDLEKIYAPSWMKASKIRFSSKQDWIVRK